MCVFLACHYENVLFVTTPLSVLQRLCAKRFSINRGTDFEMITRAGSDPPPLPDIVKNVK